MSASDLAAVRQFVIRRQCVEDTLVSLREFGRSGCEGLVLWVGLIDDGKALITSALTPPQNAIRGDEGVGYFVTSETLFRLNLALDQQQLRLIAQVHSHPGEAYHSSTDDSYAIVTTQGGLSLVVPDFGHAPASPSAWATYRLFETGWLAIPQHDVHRLIMVVDA